MDLKERYLFNQYKKLIENNVFTEFDIYGFLILMRNYLRENNLNYITEFADLVAHRERTKGIIVNSIKNAKNNKYNTINKKVEGYHGIKEQEWYREWNQLCSDNNIKVDLKTIKEISLCIFSLASSSKYYYFDNKKKVKLGKVIFIADSKDKSIELFTTEGKSNSLYVCLAKIEGFKVSKDYEIGDIYTRNQIYTYRENGKLKLRNSKKIIIEEVL